MNNFLLILFVWKIPEIFNLRYFAGSYQTVEFKENELKLHLGLKTCGGFDLCLRSIVEEKGTKLIDFTSTFWNTDSKTLITTNLGGEFTSFCSKNVKGLLALEIDFSRMGIYTVATPFLTFENYNEIDDNFVEAISNLDNPEFLNRKNERVFTFSVGIERVYENEKKVSEIVSSSINFTMCLEDEEHVLKYRNSLENESIALLPCQTSTSYTQTSTNEKQETNIIFIAVLSVLGLILVLVVLSLIVRHGKQKNKYFLKNDTQIKRGHMKNDSNNVL